MKKFQSFIKMLCLTLCVLLINQGEIEAKTDHFNSGPNVVPIINNLEEEELRIVLTASQATKFTAEVFLDGISKVKGESHNSSLGLIVPPPFIGLVTVRVNVGNDAPGYPIYFDINFIARPFTIFTAEPHIVKIFKPVKNKTFDVISIIGKLRS